MPLVSAYLLPHGMQLIPGLDKKRFSKFEALTKDFTTINKHIKKKSPDRVILISPHGIALEESFCILMNANARGYLPELNDSNVDGVLIKEQLNIALDPDFSDDLFKYLKKNGIKVDSLVFGSKNFYSPIAWGEIVPLYFLQEFLLKVPGVIITLPQSRYDFAHFKPKLFEMGVKIGEFCQNCPERVSLIISGDLSHKHQNESIFGYHPDGKIFDNLINNWIAYPSEKSFLKQAQNLNISAASCGISTLTILDGIFDTYFRQNGCSWEGQLVNYAVPTYFGMALGIFEPNKHKD
ncbi:hypothetical protein [Candidatus Lokiarchaeum ossiferum]|uniref:DODA-type extradiol aromatic ring-opening family dioxygenase n=1 Tax=Candidatus Lokiarchaeum ossiferum TaxID=2951803 RepID=UPI00352CE6FD